MQFIAPADFVRSNNGPFWRTQDAGTGHNLAYISRLTGSGTTYAHMWIGKTESGVQTEQISLNGETGEIISNGELAATVGNFQSVEITSLTGSTVPQFKLDDPDTSHPFTVLPGSLSAVTANTAGLVQETNTSQGGLLLAGLRSTGGTALSFQSHQGAAQTAAGIILAAYTTDGGTGRTDLTGSAIIVSVNAGATNRFNFLAQGTLLLNTATLPTGLTTGLVIGGGATSPVPGAATADIVSATGVDNGAGNREWQFQPEAGQPLAWGNNALRLGAGANGQESQVRHLTELTTIAAAAFTDTTIQIPAGAILLSVDVRVTVAIPTATTFDLGVSGATNRHGAGISAAANTTSLGTLGCPQQYAAATAIRITPNATPATNAGRVRVTLHYFTPTAATS